MTEFGYTLSSEEFAPNDLVAYAQEAEERGYDFVSVSDHYHPWVSEQGHAPFVWNTLGGVATVTEGIDDGGDAWRPIRLGRRHRREPQQTYPR